MIDQDDWRLQGQTFSNEELLRFERYAPPRPGSEHDHCEFCWTPFRTVQPEGPPVATEGFTTGDQRWICEPCYEDFKVVFDWRLMT